MADAEMDLAGLTRESEAIWDRNAAHWDARMAEGNSFHRELVEPATLALLRLQPGERVLEIACGNGQFARKMASLGATVLATDFSAGQLEHARSRTVEVEQAGRIEYRQVDATDEAALLALGAGQFEAAVANMALMDMAVIAPLYRALARLLRPDGRFVFSVQHPCFNATGNPLVLEELEEDEAVCRTVYAVKVTHYRRPERTRGLAMVGQPVPQYYFHRALADLLAPAFASGLALDGLEEPTFAQRTEGARPLGWGSFTDIPPVLVARLRLGPAT